MNFCDDNDNIVAKVYKSNDDQLYHVDFLNDKGVVIHGMGYSLLSRVILFAEDNSTGTYWVLGPK